MKKKSSNIEIKNKKASFEYEFIEKFTAGLQLCGTEIKSIRLGKASLVDSYCLFENGELWVKMHITEYDFGSHYNHNPKRDRKLLLTRRELSRLQRKVVASGLTIIPIRLYLSEKGWAKIDIALARGKKAYDKREDLKLKDAKRDMERHFE